MILTGIIAETSYGACDDKFYLGFGQFLVLLGLAGTGLIIALPHQHGPNETKPLGISRQEWGDVHLWLGIAFVTLMLVHLVLHWEWIKCYIKSLFGAAVKTPLCEKDSTT